PGEFKPLARHELARHVGPRAPEHDRQRLDRVLGEGFAQHRKYAAAGGVPATACSGISTSEALAAPQFLHAAGGFTTPALRHGVCRFGMLFALTPAASPHNPRSQAMLSW